MLGSISVPNEMIFLYVDSKMRGKASNSFTLRFQNDRSLSKVSGKIICRCRGRRQIFHRRERKKSVHDQ